MNDDAYNISAGQLQQFAEQWEQAEAEKKAAAERQKEVMAEAKSTGVDTKIFKRVLLERKRKPDVIAEEEAIFDTYKRALTPT